MGTRYNHLAGTSIERLAALSDGLFAVAMTLLVLDLHAPAEEAMHTEGELGAALMHLLPRLAVYLLSFLTLGIFWVGQQTQLSQMARSDRDFSWLNLIFLFVVSLMPFTTGLMAAFLTYRVALLIYWAHILLLGALLFAGWRCAVAHDLLRPDAPPRIGVSVERRIVIAQALYAFGALLCVVDTYWSLGFIVLVQLNYVIAPRIGGLDRL